MKAGVLGVVDGTFEMVDSFAETVTEDGHELDRCLEIDRVFSLPSGEMAFAGRAATERLVDRTEATIENGEIRVSETTGPVTRSTEFVGVTGEFVAVGSSTGTFAFDLIARETTTGIERATLDLDGFFAGHGDATPWKTGFYATGSDGVNGVFHGEDLRANRDLDGILAESGLNQLGLAYEYDGEDVKMTASRSGYVELYQPAAFDAAQYLEYVRDEILPHVT